MCTNTCEYALDDACDDGGPGAEFGLCDIGTDCADCGPRVPALPVSPPPAPSDDDGGDDDGGDDDGGGDDSAPTIAPPPPPPLPPYGPGLRPIDGLSSGRSAAGTASTVFLALLLTFTVLAILGATVRGLWLRRRTPEGEARWWGVARLEELLESISWPPSRSAAVPGMTSWRVRSRKAPPSAWPSKSPREESVRLAEGEESQQDPLGEDSSAGGAAVEAARRQTVVIPPGFERDTREWHFIDRSNEERSPVTAAELIALHGRGDVHDLSYVWHEEQGDWMPLSHACSVWLLQPASASPRAPDRTTSMPPPKPAALARTIEMPAAPPPDGNGESTTLRLGESAESSGGFHTQPEV